MNLTSRLRRRWIVASRLRTRTIRARLMLVVITLVIPGWLGMAAVIYGFYQSEREHTVSGTIAVAHTLVAAVDRELLDTIRTAEFLAKSPLLESGDLAAFH